jgi:septation ring formation regulator EzrA
MQAAAVKYLIETSQDETKQAKEAVNNIRSRIAKTKREIDGLNQGMIDGGIYPQSMLKLVTAKENEITQLEKQLADFKESNP